MRNVLYILVAVLLLGVSCRNFEEKNSNGNKNEMYFDYNIKGDERDSNVTIYLQFKTGGPEGPARVLDDPANVTLDGERLTVHSAKVTGPYYEIQKPAASFAGKHSIIVTTENEKKYREDFEYRPFSFKTEPAAVLYRRNLVFEFQGLKPLDYIRFAATDTSFFSKDIVEIDTVKNGRLIISPDKLKNLVDGQITLLISKETDVPVKNGTRAGGRIVLSYGLQREAELAH